MSMENEVVQIACAWIEASETDFEKIGHAVSVVAKELFDSKATVLVEDAEIFELTDEEVINLKEWLQNEFADE